MGKLCLSKTVLLKRIIKKEASIWAWLRHRGIPEFYRETGKVGEKLSGCYKLRGLDVKDFSFEKALGLLLVCLTLIITYIQVYFVCVSEGGG